MAKQTFTPNSGKGKSVEDAANVLKQSQNKQPAKEPAQPEPAKPEEKQEPGQQQLEPGGSQAGAQPEPGSQEPAPGNDGEPGTNEQGGEKEKIDGQPEPAKPEEKPATTIEMPRPYKMPVPTEEECEQFANELANSPEHLSAFRRTLERADAMVKEMNQPAKKTIEEMETINYQRLVDQYGKDFVTAKKEKSNNWGYFSRKTWNAMKNKHGWIEVTKTMPEAEAAKPEDEGK